MSTTHGVRTIRHQLWNVDQVVGYRVEAIDGVVGRIDEASIDLTSHIVIETGHWIFGKKVELPIEDVRGVDHHLGLVYVDSTKSEIKEAPELPGDYLNEEAPFS